MKTNLQRLRKAAGYKSANDFADHIGINRGTYTNYEQGKRNLTLEQAWFFADILHVTLDELAGRDFPAPATYADPRQEELNECWSRADDAQRSVILGVAQMGAGRAEPDPATPTRPPGMEGSARRAV